MLKFLDKRLNFTLAKISTYMVIKRHSLVLSVFSFRFIVVDMGPFWSLWKGLPREDGVLCSPQAGSSSPEQHGTRHLQANWDDSSSKPGKCAGSNVSSREKGVGAEVRSLRWEGRGWKVSSPDYWFFIQAEIDINLIFSVFFICHSIYLWYLMMEMIKSNLSIQGPVESKSDSPTPASSNVPWIITVSAVNQFSQVFFVDF